MQPGQETRIKNSTSETNRLHSISKPLFPLRSVLGSSSKVAHLFHACFLSCDAYNQVRITYLVRLTFQFHLMDVLKQGRKECFTRDENSTSVSNKMLLTERKKKTEKAFVPKPNSFTLTTCTLQSHLDMCEEVLNLLYHGA